MDQKHIVIAGGSGFLGKHLRAHLEEAGYGVSILTRNPRSEVDVQWDGKALGPWAERIEGAFAIVNMAGRTVDCRYNEKNRAQILSSRIDSTRVLHEAVANCDSPPRVWLNSSTSTIYKDTRHDLPANTELGNNVGDDFSMNVAKKWEAEFFGTKLDSTTQTALRTAIVLGRDGGAFPVMSKIARFGLCSPQGPGDQWISWIHINDFCRVIQFLLNNPSEGVFNLCSPAPLQNREFNQILKEKTKPWFTIPQPVWFLKLGAFFIGTEAELILKSRKVSPERLLNAGFEFEYPSLVPAVDDLI